MWNLKKQNKTKHRLKDIENKQMVAGGHGGWEKVKFIL